MKKNLLKLTILSFLSSISLSISAQYTFIPDPDFEAGLRNWGYDDGTANDGQVPTSLINTVTTLDVRGYNIKNLTGIKGFTSLKTLNASLNQLTTLDVSNMTALTTIICDSNEITSINLTNCASLQSLSAKHNKLSVLNYPNSPYLYDIKVADNSLSTLDISKLDYLQTFNIENNNFSSLDVKGKFYLSNLNCKGNPSLSCIQVTNVYYAENNFQKDLAANFKTNCKAATGYTAIPDSAFEANLRLYDLDDSQVNDGKIPTNYIEESNITVLNLHNKGIKDLTGIKAFKNITGLDVSNNKLLTLYVDSMKLTLLEASNNPDLLIINCGYNNLSYLGASGLPSMFALSVRYNKLQSLPLSGFTNLAFFDCENNQLTSVFHSAMKKLVFINFRGNNVGRVYFDASSDPIGEKRTARTTKISNFASLKHLDCGDSPLLTSIDVSNLPSLKYLNVSNTSIDSLNISNLTALDTLNATSNSNLNCIQVADVPSANSKINFNKDSETSYSTNCKISVGLENEFDNQYLIFPNPASNQVTVQLSANANVTIANTLGTAVYNQNLEKGYHTISLQNIPAGIYFIEIQNKDSSTIEKLLISK